MKKILLLLLSLTTFPAFGQYQIDLVTRQSPDRTVSQKVGFTDIELKYGSPLVKRRTIWGELVPYDQVWRAGANAATTIRFSTKVKIDGTYIEAGTYTFFVIPRETQAWTVIINSIPKQWGAFRYDPSKDVARVAVIPQAIPKQEKLIYEIDNFGAQIALVRLKWAEMMVQIPIEISLVEPITNKLKDKSQNLPNDTKWVAYLQAASLLLNEKTDLTTALEWINHSEQLAQLEMEWNPQYYPKAYILGHLYWTKAKILGALDQIEAAMVAAKQMKNLDNLSFYKKNNITEEIDQQIEIWGNSN